MPPGTKPKKVCATSRAGALAALLLFSGLAATPVSAQLVIGTATEAGSVRALEGTWVALRDSTGTTVDATLTGSDGRFLLRARIPGSYHVVARRIGYQDSESGPVVVAAGETVRHDVVVSVFAVSLSGISVDGSKACRAAPSGGSQMARLWTEARKALRIVEWVEAQGQLRMYMSDYRRELDATSLRVLAMQEQLRRGIFGQSPYVSLSAERLIGEGFILPAPDAPGLHDYFAPDAGVLLSDLFVDTHCFQVDPASDEMRVGLRFEPVEGRDLPEIEGVLWLDRTSSQLRSLEYRYVNLPIDAANTSHVGGRVEFEQLANGIWIVRSWHIRMPGNVGQVGGIGGTRAERVLQTLTEEGVRVVRVETIERETLSEASGATLVGEVRDADGRTPLSGAVVEVVPTGRQAVTNDEGVYRIGNLPAGSFEVRASLPGLDLFGGMPVASTVELAEGVTRRLPIELAPRAMLKAACADLSDPSGVWGTVRDLASGAALSGAPLVVTLASGPDTSVVSEENGAFATCVPSPGGSDSVIVAIDATGPGVPRASRPLAAAPLVRVDLEIEREAVEAMLSEQASSTSTVIVDPKDMIRILLPGAQKMAATGEKGAAGPAGARSGTAPTIRGRVVNAGDERGIEAATVRLLSEEGDTLAATYADASGAFTLPPPAAGRVVVAVDALGYSGRSERVTYDGRSVSLEIRVAPSPLEIEGLEVTVEPRFDWLERRGFYDRAERGLGWHITPEHLEYRRSSLRNAFRGIPGLEVTIDGRGIRVAGGQSSFLLGGGGRTCTPTIFIDGTRYFSDPGLEGGRQTELLDVVSLQDIMAVEVYTRASQLPPEYGGVTADNCGIVLVWTRR